MSKMYPSEHYVPAVGDVVRFRDFGIQIANGEAKRRVDYTVTAVGEREPYHFGEKHSPLIHLTDGTTSISCLAVGLTPKQKAKNG